ncbi:MAG TPA: tetratricopeptide repeat protein, partial [Candidatus Desulfofervidus auxilii]|nr:tetratricopeptide repeat protein [Candidatus Desulfofervidus auxilii]
KLLERALELDPNFALAHNDLAFIYWQKKDVKKALYHLTKAITLAPEDRDIVWNCGQIMFGLGCVKDAYEVYKSYLQKHPDEVEIKQVVEELEKTIAQ